MSDFFDARLLKCPFCGAKFASCEGGPPCDCLQIQKEEEEDDRADEEKYWPKIKGDKP